MLLLSFKKNYDCKYSYNCNFIVNILTIIVFQPVPNSFPPMFRKGFSGFECINLSLEADNSISKQRRKRRNESWEKLKKDENQIVHIFFLFGYNFDLFLFSSIYVIYCLEHPYTTLFWPQILV